MKSIYAAYIGIFALTFHLFVNIDSVGNYDNVIVVAMIVLLSLIVMIIDYRTRVSNRVLVCHALILVVVNAFFLSLIYLVGFSGHAIVMVPIFMVQGALFYASLERWTHGDKAG